MSRLVFLVLAAAYSLSATTYYVDSVSGSDNNSGTSIAKPWRSVYKVSHFGGFTRGDAVLFKAGDVWNEQLVVNASGVTYGSYGCGPKPQISGFATFTGSQIYDPGKKTWTSKLNYQPAQLFIDGERGQLVSSPEGVVNPGQWYWGNNLLTVAAASPTFAPALQISTIFSVIKVNSTDTTIQDLEISGAGWYSVEGSLTSSWDRLLIQRCLFRDSFSDSLRLIGDESHQNVIIQDNEIRNAGGNGILLNDNMTDSIIQRNTVWNNCRWRNNVPGGVAAQTWSAGIKMYASIPGYGAGTVVRFNNVYDNIPDSRLGTDSLDMARGVGIWVDTVSIPSGSSPVLVQYNLVHGNNSTGVYLENTSNCGAQFNNTFDNANLYQTANLNIQSDSGGSTTGSWASNNIIGGKGWAQVLFGGAGTPFSNNRFEYNIVNQTGTGQSFYFEGSGADLASGNVVDHNMYASLSQLTITAQFANSGRNYSTLAIRTRIIKGT